MRVFFGHQSVGQNIIDGLREHDCPAISAVVEAADDVGAPGLIHARIGANGDPAGKIDDFVARLEGPLGENLDAAFMKLCYADIGSGTDIEALTRHYRRAINHLMQQRPGLGIGHVTTPVRRMPTGARALARRLLHRPEDALEDNRRRGHFNEWLRNEFPQPSIFDLAGCESTSDRGRSTGRRSRGEYVQSLTPAYTDDGGHLNDAGRRVVAGAFCRFVQDMRVLAKRPDRTHARSGGRD